MRIALVTDAWLPQTNGVVKTLSMTVEQLRAFGHTVEVIEPGGFRTIPCPTYPEIRLAWRPCERVRQRLATFAPDAVHIATEGPLGLAARRWCLRRDMPFTTSYHTQFPEYLRSRAPIPLALSYGALRRFHAAAAHTLVATPMLQRQLEAHGFTRLVRWTRGVDTALFRPQPEVQVELPLPRPMAVYVGRVAVEKNLSAFLDLDLPGSKLIIGDGPARAELEMKYPSAHFLGYRYGEDLARHLAAADVFVFPSRTDTFGLVLLEAMACGVPVAAYPVTGPIDIVAEGVTGALDEDLAAAVTRALRADRQACRAFALRHTWAAATQQFLGHLAATSRAGAVARDGQPLMPQ